MSAAAAQLPVLLTASDGLPPALEEHLRRRIAVSLDRVTVLEGPDAVSEEVVAQLRSLGLEEPMEGPGPDAAWHVPTSGPEAQP